LSPDHCVVHAGAGHAGMKKLAHARHHCVAGMRIAASQQISAWELHVGPTRDVRHMHRLSRNRITPTSCAAHRRCQTRTYAKCRHGARGWDQTCVPRQQVVPSWWLCVGLCPLHRRHSLQLSCDSCIASPRCLAVAEDVSQSPLGRGDAKDVSQSPLWRGDAKDMSQSPLWRSDAKDVSQSPLWRSDAKDVSQSPLWRSDAKDVSQSPWRDDAKDASQSPWRGDAKDASQSPWRGAAKDAGESIE
jgi:hypothetical protein